MDRLRSLEIFAAVAERQSFAGAARALDLSNSVVTHAVQALERQIGARLLQRTTRRVTLTPEGEHVLQGARAALEAYEALAESGRSARSEVAGRVRFTAPASFMMARLAPLLSQFMAEHPKLEIELLLTDAPLDPVEHRVDLALRVAGDLPPSLVARRVGESRSGLYAAPAYLNRKGAPRHPDELARHDCLMHQGSRAGRCMPWEFRDPATQDLVSPTLGARLFANQGEALLAAALQGAGVVLLPHAYAAAAVARGELVPVLPGWEPPPRAIVLAYASRRQQPLRVRRLVEHLVQGLATPDTAPPAPTRPAQRTRPRAARDAALRLVA